MWVEIICQHEKTSVDLMDGLISLGGSSKDGICIEGLPPQLLSLRVEGERLSITAQRSIRIGDTLFPARMARLLVEGEEVRLSKEVLVRRSVNERKRQSRSGVSTAFVAKELLSGALSPQYTRAATLTCVAGFDQGRVFPIPFSENLIGRATDAAIRIRDFSVSRRHLKVNKRGTRYLVDIAATATNAVYLNGKVIQKSVELHAGDVIALGQTMLRFDAGESAPSERTVVRADKLPPPMAVEPPAESVSVPPPAPGTTLETFLMSVGIALTILGAIAASLVLP